MDRIKIKSQLQNPVSYTHLDVYKRQPLNNRHCLFHIFILLRLPVCIPFCFLSSLSLIISLSLDVYLLFSLQVSLLVMCTTKLEIICLRVWHSLALVYSVAKRYCALRYKPLYEHLKVWSAWHSLALVYNVAKRHCA